MNIPNNDEDMDSLDCAKKQDIAWMALIVTKI